MPNHDSSTLGRRILTSRWMLVAIAVAPIVSAAARATFRHWFPIGDSALLYIRAADTFTRHHPWLGSWSSASLSVGRNVNNPGAMYDWLLAPFAHVLPPGPGAAIGVASINAAAVVGTAVAARYVGGRSFERWSVLACAGLAWAMGSELLIDIWQAHALLLPFVCCLVLIIGVAAGRDRCLPWAVAVASLLVQTHISYAYILACLTVGTVAVRWATPGRDWSVLPARRMVIRSSIVLGLLWAPSFGEQWFGAGEGNLSRLVRSAGGGTVTLGWSTAVRCVAAVCAMPWWWTRRGFSTTVPSTGFVFGPDGPRVEIPGLPSLWWSVLSLMALAAVLVVLARAASRRAASVQAVACLVAVLLLSSSVLCLALLTIGPGGLAAHHVRWLWAAAVVVHLVMLSTGVSMLWPAVRRRVRRGPSTVAGGGADDQRVVWVALVAVAMVSVANVRYTAHPEGPVADRAVMGVLRQVFDSLGPLEGVGPVEYDTSNLRVYEPYSSSVMMALQERGIEFRVADEGMVRQLGEGRRATGKERVRVYQLEGIAAVDHDVDCRLVTVSQVTGAAADAAAADAEWASEALLSGRLRLDDSVALPDADALAVSAAVGGDEAALRQLVYGGGLSRLVAAGALVADGIEHEELVRRAWSVDVWMATTFGLFATLPGPCP